MEVEVTYQLGTHSSHILIPLLNPILAPVFGRDLFEGSVNLWTEEPVHLPTPAVCQLDGGHWLFVPVVLSTSQVGVAARKGDTDPSRFVEVFAADELVPALELRPGARLTIRLLPGEFLGLAA